MAATGAREAEVVALQWEDLDGDGLFIGRQHHSIGADGLVRQRTKNGRSRQVVLDSGTHQAIGNWRSVAEKEGETLSEWMLAIPSDIRPPSPRWLYDLFVRSAGVAGIPTGRADGLVPHDIRHWAASTALRDGHDPVSVAARLGHSAETLMRVYAQEIEEGQVEIAQSLALRLDGPDRRLVLVAEPDELGDVSPTDEQSAS
jgi:integrase